VIVLGFFELVQAQVGFGAHKLSEVMRLGEVVGFHVQDPSEGLYGFSVGVELQTGIAFIEQRAGVVGLDLELLVDSLEGVGIKPKVEVNFGRRSKQMGFPGVWA